MQPHSAPGVWFHAPMALRHLQLTQQQETDLLAFLDKRVPALIRSNADRIKNDRKGDEDYANSKAARAKIGTVFNESNMSVPLTSWVVDHFSSRTEDELFSRTPMAQFGPEGPADEETARGVDRWANYKVFKTGKCQNEMLEAQQSAWTHAALIMKAIYAEDGDEWEERDLNVLHDKATQQPVEVLDHGNVIEGPDALVDVQDPVSGQVGQVVGADPTIRVSPDTHYFDKSPAPIRMKVLDYAGPRSMEVDSDRFYAPMDARSFDEADILVEDYPKPMSWIVSRFMDRTWITLEQFKTALSPQDAKKTKTKRGDASKEQLGFDIESSRFDIREIWIERDVLGWGKPQRIVAWMEMRTKTLIDYEFQRKVTPSGRHPYTAIAPWKPQGGKYWWGVSVVTMLRTFQDYCDLQWNRHSYRNSINSNPIVMQNPDATQDKKTFFELKPFDCVTAASPDTKIEEWLQVFTFPKLDLDTKELIQQAIEWVNFWLGISNISQGDYSDVPQNTTLGGQEATLREASKLSKRWTRRIKNGYEDHLQKLVEIAVATMDPEEAYTYLEGDKDQMGFIAQDSIKELKLNVSMMIGRDRSTQAIQEQQMTTQIVERYFSYPPEMQMALRPVCKKQLYLLGHDDADALLPMPLMPQIDPLTGLPIVAPGTAPTAPTDAPPAEGSEGVPEQAQDAAAAPAAPTAPPAGGPP